MAKKIKRSHLKRFASDNIQVKGGTRAKSNMPQRRFYTGTIKHEDEWLSVKFPAKIISNLELQLRGLGDNPVPRGAVLLRLKKFHDDIPPTRFFMIRDNGKIKAKVFFNSEGTKFFVVEEDGIAKVLRKSLAYRFKDKAVALYNNQTIAWKEVLTFDDLLALSKSAS